MSADLVFKALADPSRRRLLDQLHTRDGRTLTELLEGAGMTRQSLSKHLHVLQEARLVLTERRGREKLHFLNPVPLQEIYDRWIGKYQKHRLEALANLKAVLEKDKDK